jgi:hypothetical protein
MGCHSVAVVIMHINKYEIKIKVCRTGLLEFALHKSLVNRINNFLRNKDLKVLFIFNGKWE